VVVGVGDDEGVGAAERGDHAEVGGVARREAQRRTCVEEVAERGLEDDVAFRRTRNKPGPGSAGAPGLGRGNCGVDDPWIGGETEVVVTRDINEVLVASPSPKRSREPAAVTIGRSRRKPLAVRRTHAGAAADTTAAAIAAISPSVQM
jgi:hypothetical protein